MLAPSSIQGTVCRGSPLASPFLPLTQNLLEIILLFIRCLLHLPLWNVTVAQVGESDCFALGRTPTSQHTPCRPCKHMGMKDCMLLPESVLHVVCPHLCCSLRHILPFLAWSVCAMGQVSLLLCNVCVGSLWFLQPWEVLANHTE